MKNSFIFSILIVLTISLFSCGNSVNSNEQNELGIEYLNTRMYDKAIKAFKLAKDNAGSFDQNKITYIRNLSNTYHEMGDMDSCLIYAKEILQICDKNSYDYYATLGDINILENDIKEGVINLKKALRLAPKSMEANNTLGLVYLGDYGIEHADIQKALKYNTTAYEANHIPALQSVLARNYYYLDENEKAESLYEALLAAFPNDIDHLYSIGLVKYELGKQDEAKNFLQRVFEMDPSYMEDAPEMIEELGLEQGNKGTRE